MRVSVMMSATATIQKPAANDPANFRFELPDPLAERRRGEEAQPGMPGCESWNILRRLPESLSLDSPSP